MATRQFTPYPTTAVTLSIVGCSLDGEPSIARVHATQLWIDLHSSEQAWGVATLCVRVDCPPTLLEATLPPSERASPPIRHLLYVQCSPTKWRRVQVLETDQSGSGALDLVLRRDDLRGKVEIHCDAVRLADQSEDMQFASRAGMRVGRSATWTVCLDETDAPTGSLLTGRWVDFTTADDHEELRRHRNALHFLSISEPPTLFLNEGVSSFKAAMEARERAGRGAAVRDSLMDTVVVGVWPQLLLAAAASVELDEDGSVSATTPWAHAALLEHARRIVDEDDAESAIARLVRTLRDPHEAPDMVARIYAYVQQRYRVRRSTEQLLQTLH